jgi:hypothetical protein
VLASWGVVINPDKIQPGMVLTIPDLDKEQSQCEQQKAHEKLP